MSPFKPGTVSGNVVSVLAQVVDGDGPNLLGSDWLIELEVDLGSVQVNTMRNTSDLDEVLDKHSTVFGADLGCMKGQKSNYMLMIMYHLNSINLVLYLLC